MLSPTTQIIMPKWSLDIAIRSIPKYKVTTIGLIPSIIHSLVNSPKFMDPNLDLSSVTMVGSGAAYLPPKLSERFRLRLKDVASVGSGYGLSECVSV